MSKTVYSVVLSPHVVESLDAMAARESLSRSAAIERILTQHLALPAPEIALQAMLEEAEQLLAHSAVHLVPVLSDGLLVVRAPVRFRYNPTMRYAVELKTGPRGTEGELKISARTTSDRLTEALDAFYRCFQELSGFDPALFEHGGGRLSIRFALPPDDPQAAAQQIAALLGLAQRALHDYFLAYPDSFGCRLAVRDACDEAFGRAHRW